MLKWSVCITRKGKRSYWTFCRPKYWACRARGAPTRAASTASPAATASRRAAVRRGRAGDGAVMVRWEERADARARVMVPGRRVTRRGGAGGAAPAKVACLGPAQWAGVPIDDERI